MANVDEVLGLLCSHVKLERDRGVSSLEGLLSEQEGLKNNAEQISSLLKSLVSLVQTADKSWEIRHGGLLGAKLVILANIADEEFLENMRTNALVLIHDEEFRVRILAGEVLGALCQIQGSKVYISCKDEVLSSVSDNLERHLSDVPSMLTGVDQLQKKMSEKNAEANKPADAAKIFHDTAGWKNLETSMRCLQSLIEGCGEDFNDHISQSLLDLIFQALNHANRFVRETGYQVCGSLVSLGRPQDESLANSKSGIALEKNAIVQHGDQFSSYLQKGLADNWSQVRMAASVATRQFLQTLPPQARERFYPKILPAMCLNRYYVAEGVRIYSQKSWKMVMGMEGKQLVEKYIKETVGFYISQTKADNHAVREAACACIAELGIKVNPDCTRAYVTDLLDALIVCFKDDSWPVRDAACVACGNFILCFPEECKSHMEELYPLFFTNLEDNIPSVRQGAAISLANVVKAYGKEQTVIVFQKLKTGLKEVENQKENTEKYSGMDKGPATFGVVKRLRDNDMDLHTDRQMYSCGSLAPKMGRGGGCMDHLFKRPPEPWEITDGNSSSTEHESGGQKLLKILHDSADCLSSTAKTLESQGQQIDNACRTMNKLHSDLGVAETIINSMDSWFNRWDLCTPEVLFNVPKQANDLEKTELPVLYANTEKEKHISGLLVLSGKTIEVMDAQRNQLYSFTAREVSEGRLHTPYEMTLIQSEIGKPEVCVHLISAELIKVIPHMNVMLGPKLNFDEPPDSAAMATASQSHDDDHDELSVNLRLDELEKQKKIQKHSSSVARKGVSKTVSETEAAQMAKILQDMKTMAVGIQDEQNRQLGMLDLLSDSVDKANERIRNDTRTIKRIT